MQPTNHAVTRRWVAAFVRAFAVLAMVSAGASFASAQPTDPLATATAEGITVPDLPAWSVQSTEPILRATRDAPAGEIAVTSVRAADVEAAILGAMRTLIDPSIDAAYVSAPVQTSPTNLPTGTWTQRLYRRREEIVAVLTLEREGTIYLVLARGTQAAFTQAVNQAVTQILSGMEIDADEGEAVAAAAETEPADDAFTAEDATVEVPAGTLHGTLLVPAGIRDPPVALLIAGSGPTDRNGNSPLIQVRNDSLKLLAEGLARNGVASLRYDKRGIAASAGALTAEADVRFGDFVSDAAAWLELLAADDRFTERIVIGHSEGSLIGMLASAEADVAAFVSLAGPGRGADDVLRTQLADQLPAPLLEEASSIVAALEAGETVDDVSTELASLFRPSVQPYLISWFAHDPAEAIARLEMPVLIVQGTTDIQVAVAEAERLAAADPDAELVLVEDMNHVLKEVPEGEDPLASYGDPTLPLADGLVHAIVGFVRDAVQAP
jgi:pimeloyl-ACP methyl ester carboxylesterase